MKRFLTLIFTLILVQNICLSNQSNVSFVYINGSNNNDQKMKNWYQNGIKKLHPMLKKKFETNKDTKYWFSPETGIYHINTDPVIFFWGDRSKVELDWVKRQVLFSKTLAPTLGYQVRELLTAYLHDAIWVQKNRNMVPITQNLNDVVKQEYTKGNQVILYGYSAGTFVTSQYLYTRLKYINPIDLFKVLDVPIETQDFIAQHPQKDTCILALKEAKIGVLSDDGHLYIDRSQDIQKNYLNLDAATDKVCAPSGSLKGIVNFASPVPLFYSDMADHDYENTYYYKNMVRYIIENGLFLITVNFREDPLGFPTTRNLTISEIETISGEKYNNPSGFIYDNSKVWSKRSVLFAHTSYWSAKGTFSNAIVKTLTNGMRFNYDLQYQQKMIKKRNQGFDIWD